MPFGDTYNSMEMMLPKLKKFDDLTVKEWIEKAMNAETIFAPKPEDSKQDIDKKDSLKRWYSMQRFELEKKYFTRDAGILTDGKKMSQFITDIRNSKVPLYFECAMLPTEYGPLREISGTNYHKFMTQSNLGKAKLVLITHPDPEKNYDIVEQY